MNLRPLGRSGLSIAPLVLGGNVFGWSADEARSFQVLDAFADAGLTMIDTADAYSAWVPGNHGGESETIIGRWLARSGNLSRTFCARPWRRQIVASASIQPTRARGAIGLQ